MAEKTSDLFCCVCWKPAVWVRHTQFSGSHPFCLKHAEEEDDFGENDPSYFFWLEVPPEAVAEAKHPDFIRKWNIQESEFEELARYIHDMKYDKVVSFYQCCTEALIEYAKEAQLEGRLKLEARFLDAVRLSENHAESLARIFEECKKEKLKE